MKQEKVEKSLSMLLLNAIGMSQAAYSKIERGETEVKVSHVYSIAAYLKTSIYELLPEAIASNSFDGDEYLLKPLVFKFKSLWFAWKVKRRLRKMPVNHSNDFC